MKIKKYPVYILSYITIMLFASCEPVTEYVEIEKEVIVTEFVTEAITETEYVNIIEYVDRETIIEKYIEVDKIVEIITEVEVDKIIETEKIIEVEVDNVINTETIVYIEKEVYVVSEPEIFIQPIKEYYNYVTLSNKVLGVTENGFEEIPLIADLFKIGDIIYFSIDGVAYSQENLVVVALEMPVEVPESIRVEFQSGNYRVENDVYGSEDITRVYNGSPVISYYIVDSACMRGSDLIYSCPIDTGTRLKGIWIWTVNGNPTRLFENGRIW